ncbi:MAG: 6-pyruvoyl tetrahydropterin synthase family protein [Phycisphaerales bacterium]|nr:6-pyruvoyl tetrahydropterin synthase family protein [Phycisphaerales bacterium]
MPFEIATVRRFAAAHALRLYDGAMEPVHGHNWRVRVRVAAGELDPIGVVMDFHELERLVDAVVVPWHNRHLNECPPFAGTGPDAAANAGAGLAVNPSAENVALHVGRAVGPKLPAGVRLVSAEVWETDENAAVYRP